MPRKRSHPGNDRRRRSRPRFADARGYATLEVGANLRMASPTAVVQAMAALPQDLDWSVLAARVVPLFARRRPLPAHAPAPIQVVLPPGLSVGFGVDIGPAYVSITNQLLQQWGVGLSELIQQALANTERLARLLKPGDVQHGQLQDGVPVASLTARILPASALLFVPRELERLFGPQERLFVAPMRDLLLALPGDVDLTLAALVRDVAAEHDPNAIALEGVRLRHGRLTCEALGGVVGSA